jgi:hypothetical protein
MPSPHRAFRVLSRPGDTAREFEDKGAPTAKGEEKP